MAPLHLLIVVQALAKNYTILALYKGGVESCKGIHIQVEANLCQRIWTGIGPVDRLMGM